MPTAIAAFVGCFVAILMGEIGGANKPLVYAARFVVGLGVTVLLMLAVDQVAHLFARIHG
jgi:hypothetical protein